MQQCINSRVHPSSSGRRASPMQSSDTCDIRTRIITVITSASLSIHNYTHVSGIVEHVMWVVRTWHMACTPRARRTPPSPGPTCATRSHLKHVLHLEAVLAQPLHADNLGQRYITDGPFALRFGIAERLRRQPEVALLEVAAPEALADLRPFRHQTAESEQKTTFSTALALVTSLSVTITPAYPSLRNQTTHTRTHNRFRTTDILYINASNCFLGGLVGGLGINVLW